MFADSLTVEQWRERIRFSRSTEILLLIDGLSSFSRAFARNVDANCDAMIIRLCHAELARRASLSAGTTFADTCKRPTLDLNRTNKE